MHIRTYVRTYVSVCPCVEIVVSACVDVKATYVCSVVDSTNCAFQCHTKSVCVCVCVCVLLFGVDTTANDVATTQGRRGEEPCTKRGDNCGGLLFIATS